MAVERKLWRAEHRLFPEARPSILAQLITGPRSPSLMGTFLRAPLISDSSRFRVAVNGTDLFIRNSLAGWKEITLGAYVSFHILQGAS